MVGRRPGKTHPLAGRNGGETLATSGARTVVPQPNGLGWWQDAPMTSALTLLPRTAVKTNIAIENMML
jgi:hypothetical protein